MPKFEVVIRQYECHPETCPHWEHYTYWVLENGAYWVEGFDTREEAEHHLIWLEKVNAKNH